MDKIHPESKTAEIDYNKTNSLKYSAYKDINFDIIPSSDEFQNIKVKPERRWFNSLMALFVTITGICFGVSVGCIILIFI